LIMNASTNFFAPNYQPIQYSFSLGSSLFNPNAHTTMS
jgi:hypothetical protein